MYCRQQQDEEKVIFHINGIARRMPELFIIVVMVGLFVGTAVWVNVQEKLADTKQELDTANGKLREIRETAEREEEKQQEEEALLEKRREAEEYADELEMVESLEETIEQMKTESPVPTETIAVLEEYVGKFRKAEAERLKTS